MTPPAPQRSRARAPHVLVAFLALILILLTASCAKVKDESIPRLLEPLAESDLNGLVARLNGLTTLQALRASRLLIQFIDAESKDKYRAADGQLAMQRPDKIRLIVQLPVTGTRIAEMVSLSNHFKVAIYYPDKYRRFLSGTNDADYSRWREKLGREGRSALVDARPFHFTDALMMRPLQTSGERLVYGLEEALIEETDMRQGAKRNARLLRSFYVVSEVDRGSSLVRRRFWFDRTNKLIFTRQQIFDDRARLATDVFYSGYEKLSEESPELWPGVVLVSRPHDNYSARLTFVAGRFEVNPSDLSPNAFVLENKENLPVTDLDVPSTP